MFSVHQIQVYESTENDLSNRESLFDYHSLKYRLHCNLLLKMSNDYNMSKRKKDHHGTYSLDMSGFVFCLRDLSFKWPTLKKCILFCFVFSLN